jgi:hypothetical protein
VEVGEADLASRATEVTAETVASTVAEGAEVELLLME